MLLAWMARGLLKVEVDLLLMCAYCCHWSITWVWILWTICWSLDLSFVVTKLPVVPESKMANDDIGGTTADIIMILCWMVVACSKRSCSRIRFFTNMIYTRLTAWIEDNGMIESEIASGWDMLNCILKIPISLVLVVMGQCGHMLWIDDMGVSEWCLCNGSYLHFA